MAGPRDRSCFRSGSSGPAFKPFLGPSNFHNHGPQKKKFVSGSQLPPAFSPCRSYTLATPRCSSLKLMPAEFPPLLRQPESGPDLVWAALPSSSRPGSREGPCRGGLRLCAVELPRVRWWVMVVPDPWLQPSVALSWPFLAPPLLRATRLTSPSPAVSFSLEGAQGEVPLPQLQGYQRMVGEPSATPQAPTPSADAAAEQLHLS